MMSEKHNGFSNYPTWSLIAEIDNKVSLYNKFYGRVRSYLNKEEPLPRSKLRGVLMNELKEFAEKTRPTNNSFWDGITNDVVKEQINYYEIAESILDTLQYPKH